MFVFQDTKVSEQEGIGGIGGQIRRPVVMVGQWIDPLLLGHHVQEVVFARLGIAG